MTSEKGMKKETNTSKSSRRRKSLCLVLGLCNAGRTWGDLFAQGHCEQEKKKKKEQTKKTHKEKKSERR
jgi:hypothetical protein